MVKKDLNPYLLGESVGVAESAALAFPAADAPLLLAGIVTNCKNKPKMKIQFNYRKTVFIN